MNTSVDIDESLRAATVLDRGGYHYVVHPLMDGIPRVDPALLEAFAEWAAEQPFVQEASVLLTPEAMGIPLAAAVSLRTGKPYVVVRKRSYGLPDETVAYCETGYSQSCLYINGLEKGDKIAIIDDVLSTGGTLAGLLSALKDHDVRGVAVFADKGDKAERIARHHGVPITAMRRLQIDAQGVEVSS